MKINTFFEIKENELPLDNIVTDGGYTSIFQTIACIGDSLSSGEFEAIDEKGNKTYHDYYEYSWGQFMAREAGVTVYNFSRGGMSAKEYCDTFAKEHDFYNEKYKAKAYIIALGVNDLLGLKHNIGSFDDIDLNDENNNKDSFIGNYAKIIQQYKKIEPNAKFFLMTMLDETDESEEVKKAKLKHRDILFEFAKIFPKTYVLDFYKYAPKYDKAFRDKFYLYGHLNPMGYKLTAKLVESYIDYIVRSDFKAFRQVGFIGKEQYNINLD